MNETYEEKYHIEEEKNWWFVARRNTLMLLLKDAPKDAKILDIGCAGGPLLTDLVADGFTKTYGLDFSEKAVLLCAKRGLKNVDQMDAHYPNFEPNFFDIIIASDSLEHLQNDLIALENWNKILKKGGKLIVFVPAYQFLWSSHDVINQHFRRYTKKNLVNKIESFSFEVIQKGYWNFAMFFPTFIIRLLERLLPKKQNNGQISDSNSPLNPFLIAYLKLENKLFKLISGFPFGVSVFCVAIKK